MSPRVALWLSLVVAALGAALWIWIESPSSAPLAVPDAVNRAHVAPTPAPELLGTGRVVASRDPAAVGALWGTVRESGRAVTADVELWRVSNAPSSLDHKRVVLTAATPVQIARTRTDERGTFSFLGLAPARYHVFARTAAGARGTETVDVGSDQPSVGTDVEVMAGGTLVRGQVLRADGAPWRGAVVVSPSADDEWPLGPGPGEPAAATTDAEGRFEVQDVPPGYATVHVFEVGRFRAYVNIGVPRDEEVRITLPFGGVTTPGVVLDHEFGTPVAGAVVEFWVPPAPQQAYTFMATTTDAEGRFEVPQATGIVRLRVAAPGWPILDEQVEPRGGRLEVRLRRAGSLRGRVLRADDLTPVAGIKVQTLEQSTRTDRNGAFSFEQVPAGGVGLSVVSEEWTSGESSASVASGEETTAEILVSPAVTLVGTVVMPDGTPAEGARMDVLNPDSEGVMASTASGPDGSFRCAGLRLNDRYLLHATAPGFGAAHAFVSPEQRDQPTVLRLEVARALDVHVTGPDGTPAAMARVRAHGWILSPGLGAWTDGEGRARLTPLPPGLFHVDVAASGADDWSAVLGLDNLAESGGVLEVRLETSGAGAAFQPSEREQPTREVQGPVTWAHRLEIVDEAGTAVPRVRVLLSDRHQGTSSDCVVRGGDVTLHEPGAARVLVMDPQSADGRPLELAPVMLWLEPGRDDVVRVVLPPGFPISGVVRDAAGRPIAGADVTPTARTDNAQRLGARSDADGAFRIAAVARGRYFLRIDASRFVPTEVEVEAGASGLDVRLEAKREVDALVTVLDEHGAPVPMAKVELQTVRATVEEDGKAGFEWVGQVAERWTDLNGRARFAEFDPEGLYQLDAEGPRHRSELFAGKVVPWRPGPTTLHLPVGRTIEGLVVDTQGRPVEGVCVDILWAGPPDAPRQQVEFEEQATDEHGRFRVGWFTRGPWRLAAASRSPRRYRIFASPSDPPAVDEEFLAEVDGEPVTVEAGARGVRLVLPPAPDLTVRVVGAGQVPRGTRAYLVKEALADLHDVAAPVFHRRLSEAGEARFRYALGDTTYRLWIGPLAGGNYVLESGLKASQTVHEVRPKPGVRLSGRVLLRGKPRPGAHVALHGLIAELYAQTDREGRFEWDGLPPGTWSVRAWTQQERFMQGEDTEGAADLTTGEPGEIVLVPR